MLHALNLTEHFIEKKVEYDVTWADVRDDGSIPKIVQSQIASENSEEILEYLRMKCFSFS